MNKDKEFKIFMVVALIVSVVGLSIAYATYSETLKVSGSIKASSASDSWDVHFEGIDGSSSIGSPTLGGIASVVTAPTFNATNFTGFEVNFFAPGDSVVYNFRVKNSGMLDAKLTTASIGSISCAPAVGSTATAAEATALCNDLTYSLTYADGSAIAADATGKLSKDTFKELKLSVSWNSSSVVRLSDDVKVTIGETTFVYTQD